MWGCWLQECYESEKFTKFLSSNYNLENTCKDKDTKYMWSGCSFLVWLVSVTSRLHREFLSNDCTHQVSVHTELQSWASYDLFELNRNIFLLLIQQNCFHCQVCKTSLYYTVNMLKSQLFILFSLTLWLTWILK